MPTVGDFLPGYEATGFAGIGAPKGTPADIIDRLNKELNAGLADPEIEAQRGQQIISGEIPSALRPPPGCRFHTRCPHVMEVCKSVDPPMRDRADGRAVACHLHT